MLALIKNRLVKQCTNKKISSTQVQDITDKLTIIENISIDMTTKLAKLENQLEERGRIETIIVKKRRLMGSQDMNPTYNLMPMLHPFPKVTGTKRVNSTPRIVFIKSTDENKEAEDVKKLVKDTINHGELGLKVRRIRKVTKGIMIEAQNSTAASDLRTTFNSQRQGPSHRMS